MSSGGIDECESGTQWNMTPCKASPKKQTSMSWSRFPYGSTLLLEAVVYSQVSTDLYTTGSAAYLRSISSCRSPEKGCWCLKGAKRGKLKVASQTIELPPRKRKHTSWSTRYGWIQSGVPEQYNHFAITGLTYLVWCSLV